MSDCNHTRTPVELLPTEKGARVRGVRALGRGKRKTKRRYVDITCGIAPSDEQEHVASEYRDAWVEEDHCLRGVEEREHLVAKESEVIRASGQHSEAIRATHV